MASFFKPLVVLLLGAISLDSSSAWAAYQVRTIFHQDPVQKFNGNVSRIQYDSSPEPYLVYASPDSQSSEKLLKVNELTWKTAKNKASSRSHLFLQLYFANSRARSNSAQRHKGCFLGNAQDVVEKFFSEANDMKDIDKIVVSVNSDQSMIGFDFNYLAQMSKKSNPKKNGADRNANVLWHYRLPHCFQGGKAPLFKIEELENYAGTSLIEPNRSVAQSIKDLGPSPHAESSFAIHDQIDVKEVDLAKKNQLPKFELRADYDKMKPNDHSRPWKGMSVADEASAKKVADVVLQNFYESLVLDQKNIEKNFIAQNTPPAKSKWCHMPWLNVGESGREAVHGLTKERDLEPSKMYPKAGTVENVDGQLIDRKGAGWGIGFYNDISCPTIGKVFGTPSSPVKDPQFMNIQFPDGTASIKILFTTAHLDELKNSFKMMANVSLNEETTRSLRPVRLLQIDVAIKDSTVIGVNPQLDNWFMITYYFDESYKSDIPFKITNKALEPLLKMRPAGVQTGLTPNDSIIFAKALTNSVGTSYYKVPDRFLNGPADNPKANCLACHGAAGTKLRMVPGVKDAEEYQKAKALGTSLDFSQQLGLAKKNYETRSGQQFEKAFKR